MQETFSSAPEPEEFKSDTAAQDAEWHSAFDSLLEEAIQEAPPGVGDLDPTFTPRMIEDFNKRGYGDTCAIRCQEVILHKYGIDVDESTLVDQAIKNHFYYPGQATLPQDVGGLLKMYDIDIHQYTHADVYTLAVELARGHEVMIGVNADELQHPLLAELRDHLQIGTADHAVIVSGIDTQDSDHVQVVVIDPDTGDAAAHYPLEIFINAWSGSDFFLTATNEPPPQILHAPEMKHFDYINGHIEEVAGVPYAEFVDYANNPEEAAHLLQEYQDHELSVHAEHEEQVSPEHSDIDESLHPALLGSAYLTPLHESEESAHHWEDDQGHDDLFHDDTGELDDSPDF